MIRKNFKELMKNIVSESYDNECDALEHLIDAMRGNEYKIQNNDFYLCSMRGGLKMTQLNRIQNYHKKFKAHQIRNSLKDVYDYIKEQQQ